MNKILGSILIILVLGSFVSGVFLSAIVHDILTPKSPLGVPYIDGGRAIKLPIMIPESYTNSTVMANGTVIISVTDGNLFAIGNYYIEPGITGDIFYHGWQGKHYAFVMSSSSDFPPIFNKPFRMSKGVIVYQTTFCPYAFYRDDLCQTFWRFSNSTQWHIQPAALANGQPFSA